MEDVSDADGVITKLCTSLYQRATLGTDKVLELFCEGCRIVLGFTEVTRWRCVERDPVVKQRRVLAVGETREMSGEAESRFGRQPSSSGQRPCWV